MSNREKQIPASHELILSDCFTAWVQSRGLEGRLASKSRVVLSSAAPIWHRRPRRNSLDCSPANAAQTSSRSDQLVCFLDDTQKMDEPVSGSRWLLEVVS